jgi:hypothetical protein
MINKPKTVNVETVRHARRRILASPIFCAGVRPVPVSVQPAKKFSYAVWRSQDCVEEFVPFMKGRANGMDVTSRQNRAERPRARCDIRDAGNRAYFFSPVVT